MQRVADDTKTAELIRDMADWVRQRMDAAPGGEWALVGVRSRGDVIARRVAEQLEIGRVGTLDITLYRDDLSELANQPVVRTTEIDFAVDGLDVVLIDDVIMSGRSVRAALQSVMDLGRPRRVWLAVLVDRGGRELPITPDFAALTHRTTGNVRVMLTPTDDRDTVEVEDDGE